MSDWDVSVEIVRSSELDCPHCAGQCTWHITTKEAIIQIIDPEDYKHPSGKPLDIEKTLIHEILHLHFAPIMDYVGREAFFNDGSPADIATEQAIDLIAQALLKSEIVADSGV